MSKEEIEKILRWLKTDGTVFLADIEKIEKYIDQIENENGKLNKIIDEMAKYIATDEKEFSTKICDDMSAKCETDTDCKLCIKQYFEKKVKKG